MMQADVCCVCITGTWQMISSASQCEHWILVSLQAEINDNQDLLCNHDMKGNVVMVQENSYKHMHTQRHALINQITSTPSCNPIQGVLIFSPPHVNRVDKT